MRFFKNVNKKIFWFWLGWMSASIVLFVTSFFYFFTSLWLSLAGFILFSILFSPFLLMAVRYLASKFGFDDKENLKFYLIIISLFFLAFYTAFSLHKHINFFTGYDLAVFDQAVWHMSRFEVPESSVRNVPVIFADHFDPILVFLAPVYRVFNDARALLFIQNIFLVLPVMIIYLWGKEWGISHTNIFMLSFFYLTSPAVQSAANFDFHEIIFAPLIMMSAFYFLVKKRWVYYFFMILLLMFTKENLSLLVIGISLFVIFREKLCGKGILTFLLGLGGLFLITKVIMPCLNYHSSYVYWNMYPGFEQGIIKGILYYAGNLTEFFNLVIFTMAEKWWSVLFFSASFIFPLLSVPSTVFLAAPIVAERVLSSYPYLGLMRGYYNLMFVPITVIAILYFLKQGRDAKTFLKIRERLSTVEVSFTGLVVALPIVMNLLFSYQFTYLLAPVENWQSVQNQQRKEELEDLLEKIPDGASVSASQILLPHLSHRDKLYALPRISDADFIIMHFCYSEPCNTWPLESGQMTALYMYLRAYPYFELVEESYYGALFRRIKTFDETVRKDVALLCSGFIKSAGLEPVHEEYMTENCQM